jgi:hypothetical protein
LAEQENELQKDEMPLQRLDGTQIFGSDSELFSEWFSSSKHKCLGKIEGFSINQQSTQSICRKKMHLIKVISVDMI